MECLTQGRSDIVVIKKFRSNSVFAVHNMTENKINQLIDDELPVLIKNDLNMQDYLTSKKHNSKYYPILFKLFALVL